MGEGVPFFDFEKGLFLPYLPSELSEEVEILYAHLVGVLDVPFKWSQLFSFISLSHSP